MFYVCTVCLKTAMWPFVTFLGQGLAFFYEDRLATPLCSLARFDLANRSVHQSVQLLGMAQASIFAARPARSKQETARPSPLMLNYNIFSGPDQPVACNVK